MKKIIYLLLCLGILYGNSGYSYAADNFSWDRIDEESGYDYIASEIYFEYSLNSVNILPESDYRMVFRIDNDRYEKIFTYDSAAGELRTEFRFIVEQAKAGGTYDIDYSIYEVNSGENVRDKQYQAVFLESGKDIIDWSLGSFDIQEIPEENSVLAYFEVPYEYSPTQDYTLNLMHAGSTYTQELEYNKSNDTLSGTLEITFPEGFNPKDYMLNFEVRDNRNTVVSSESTTFSFYVEPITPVDLQEETDTDNLPLEQRQSIEKILEAYVMQVQKKYLRTQNEIIHIQRVINIFTHYNSDNAEHLRILEYAAGVLEMILDRDY